MVHKRWFGTDGMRGKANSVPIRPDYLVKLAQATTKFFLARPGYHHRLVIIGKDTRLSGYMVESALMSGFISAGMDVRKVGPLPTSAVAMLTRSLRADLGVMISASHNPYTDNGVKLFGPNGHKLSDEEECAIEALMESEEFVYASPNAIGRAATLADAQGRYIESLKASLPRQLSLDGLRVVVDCAHGAAYRIAPAVFFELGAEVIPLSVSPNGTNINADCGAMAPQEMAQAVVDHGADIGFALDGDSDRLVVATRNGDILPGEAILGVLARWMQQKGELFDGLATPNVRGGQIVTTTMASLGLEAFLRKDAIEVLRAPVGDRYVMESMRAHGCLLGGEPSGHIMLHRHALSADAVLVGLHLLACMMQCGKSIADLAVDYTTFPIYKQNIERTPAVATQLHALDMVRRVAEFRETWQAGSSPKGQILLRESGTEPIVRLMVEHEDDAVAQSAFQELFALLTGEEAG